jgi:hypothetical protein
VDIAAIIVAFAASMLTIGIVVFACRKPGYSHWRHTISELGETGAPDEKAVAYGLFLPVGLLLVLVSDLASATSVYAAGLGAAIAFGYLGAAFFPCDPGSPLAGSTSQGLHNLAGAVQYIGGAIALARLGEQVEIYRAASMVVGSVAIALSVPQLGRVRGGVQRLAEVTMFVCLFLVV